MDISPKNITGARRVSGEALAIPAVLYSQTSVATEKSTIKYEPEAHGSIDPEVERAIVRKIDYRIIPLVMSLYMCSFLDRINIGNARLYGLEKELGMKGNQYQTAVSLLFVTYLSFEVPSNMVMKKFTPSRWISFITVAWGIVATFTGLVKSYGGLIAVRLILGVFEAGLFPGILLYLTFFYTKKELTLRFAFFFVSAATAGAFGGLLAYAIGFMDGLAGMKGWRWIFILEGIPTVIAGVIAYFVLADSPETASYLTPEEREIVSRRLRTQHEGVECEDVMHKRDAVAAVLDWKCWAISFFQYGYNSMLYSFSTFLPTIIKAIGGTRWSSATVQALTIPCYATGAIVFLISSYLSDKYQRRCLPTVIAACVSMLGYIILIAPAPSGVHYFACYLVAAGLYVACGTPMSWNSQNYPRYGKRAIASGMHVAISNSSGIAAPFLYATIEAPRYVKGHVVTLSLAAFATLGFAFIGLYYNRENEKRDAGERDYLLHGLSAEEIRELGDDSPKYRYVI